MSADVIQAALGIPAERWPPDHYELLGLPHGEADAARVETHVLDRMERLRRYQLAHPDVVTDAMNRLAQALVCLTDPALKRAYDSGLGIARPASDTPVVAPIPTPTIDTHTDARSEQSRRRAVLRRWRRTWTSLGRSVADSARPFATRTEVVELAMNLRTVRDLAARPDAPLAAEPGQHGALVIGLARQPMLVSVLSELSPTFRRGLAVDWSAAQQRLTAAAREARGAGATAWRAFWRRARRTVRTGLARYPDAALVGVALLALAVAAVRGLG